eukprot:SAG22_NODE_10722_length_519_cov_1.323810_1_plen_50_part_01
MAGCDRRAAAAGAAAQSLPSLAPGKGWDKFVEAPDRRSASFVLRGAESAI